MDNSVEKRHSCAARCFEGYTSKIKDLRKKAQKRCIWKVSGFIEKYLDSLEKLFTLQNIADLTVMGYKVFTLDFGVKISGDATKPGRFYFGFTHLRGNGKTNPVQNVPELSRISNIRQRTKMNFLNKQTQT